jgi:hypothetical protein
MATRCVSPPKVYQFASGEIHIFLVEPYLAGTRAGEKCHDFQERGLSGTIGPQEAYDFPPVQGKPFQIQNRSSIINLFQIF